MSRPGAVTTPTLFYDPDCGFCTRAAGWLVRFGARCAVRPLTPDSPVDLDRASREVPFVALSGEVAWGSDAIAAALATCRAPWPLAGWLLRTPPVRPVARAVYRWVAAHRHELPGGAPTCRLDP